MLCVRGGGNTIPFEEDSLLPLIYLLLLNDSVIQPQNQSPEEGRKSSALKHQCPCEVLLCGTFLKNNHIRRLSGRRNPPTILWDSCRTRQPGMGVLWEPGLSVFSSQRRHGLGEGLNIRFAISDTRGYHIPKERTDREPNSERECVCSEWFHDSTRGLRTGTVFCFAHGLFLQAVKYAV